MKVLSQEEWVALGTKLYGEDKREWKFKCVQCGEAQTYNDFIKIGVEDPTLYVHFSCIGRFTKDRGCDWTLGGLFQLHKQEVIDSEGNRHRTFEFADTLDEESDG